MVNIQSNQIDYLNKFRRLEINVSNVKTRHVGKKCLMIISGRLVELICGTRRRLSPSFDIYAM